MTKSGGLSTMIENLTRRQEEIQSQIAELEAQQQESDSNKEDILRQIKFLNQTLTEIRINLREKRGKLEQVNQELDSLKSTYNAKLKGLDAIMKKDNVMINYINRDAKIILKTSFFLTSSLRTPKFFVKEFCYFLMSCHQHCLGIDLLVQR